MDDLTTRIMALVARADYKPLTTKQMAKRLEIPAAEYAEFRTLTRDLVSAGKLDRSKDRTLAAAGSAESKKGVILGTFRRNAKGFGFVRPLKSTTKTEDIFIPADKTIDASSGDEVAVKISGRSQVPGQGPRGRITRVVTRATGLFVGTYYEEAGDGLVKVDGTTFHQPLYVGDPGAKGARPGDKVAIEIVRYPSPDLEGEGVIVEVLGARGQPGVDTLSIIRAFNIPDEFDEDVLEDAREQAKAFDEKSVDGRLDLRDTLTVTIDPRDARDFDDAITLSRDERGYWRLGVHIADVSHFVKPGSPLDREARKRGNSVYLPDRVIPMLPEVLSNSLASLQQDRVRYTMSAFIEFNAEGIITDKEFARSAIQVDRRFTYEDAFAVMTRPSEPHEDVTPEVRDLLLRMLELAMILRRRRFERGALELVMPEVEVDLGDVGEVTGAHLASNDVSHQVIEEFMLAANEAVATTLTERGVGFLRRVHPDPDVRKLEQFAEFVASLGYEVEDPQSRFSLQRVLRESDDKPERYAVHYGLLRSLKQATYTPEQEGHFALASDDYCHFTSPIRRYPDLQVHRQLNALLIGKKPKSDPDELIVLGEHCTRTERRADAAERELIKIKLLTHLETRIGEVFHAVIIGVEDFGFFCQLTELPVEGLVHVTSLADDYYYLEAETHTLIGRRAGRRYRLGDKLEVRVVHVDVDRRELDLNLASVEPTSAAKSKAGAIDDAERFLPPSRTGGRTAPRKPTTAAVRPHLGPKRSKTAPRSPSPPRSPKKPKPSPKGKRRRKGR